MTMTVTLADIEAARRTIAGQVLHTPMLPAPQAVRAHRRARAGQIREPAGHQLVQGARRAQQARRRSAPPQRARGVIAMSAGNHAQALAYHAARLGIPATIVMPVTTPFVKIEATQAHGAEVVLDGETLAEAQARAEAIARERGLTLVHPYDDALVIAGQGTIALEMLEEAPDLEMLVIPIGGGGLIAGNAVAARAPRSGDRDHRGGGRALSLVLECAARREPAVRRRHAGGRHRGQECRRADAADRARAGQRDRAGRRGASRARGQCLSHAAEDNGGRRRRRRARRHAGQARAIPRPQGRPDPVRRQYRPAHPRLRHGARAQARETASSRSGSPSRTGPGCSGRSPRAWASSAPIFSRSITAGCFSTCRPRAPSSTSRWRRATAPTPRRSCGRLPPTVSRRSESRWRPPWSDARRPCRRNPFRFGSAIDMITRARRISCRSRPCARRNFASRSSASAASRSPSTCTG